MRIVFNLAQILPAFIVAGFMTGSSMAQDQITGPEPSHAFQITTVQQGTILHDGFSPSGRINGSARILAPVSAPGIDWNYNYGSEPNDECYHAIQTTDGGYALIGRTLSYGAGNYDAWLLKTDTQGGIQWSASFGDSYIDEAYKVKQLSDGGFIIAGMTTAFGWSGEGWLIRTDALGNIVWNRAYHPQSGSVMSAWDYLYDVVENTDGSYTAAGVAAVEPGSMQAWVIKVNASGDLLWEHLYGGEFWERIFCLETLSGGGYVAAGDMHYSYDGNTYRHDGWLLRLNPEGDTLWTKHFGEEAHDIFRSVKPTPEGGYVLVGERQPYVDAGFQGWMVCTDDEGNARWQKDLSRGGLYGVQVKNNDYIAAGATTPDMYSPFGGWLVKIDNSGDVVWESFLPASEIDDFFLSLSPCSDGGWVAGGRFNSNFTVGDYWLVKFQPEQQGPYAYFFEDFDEATPPALPEEWGCKVSALLSNTIAEVRTMEQGSTPSQPHAVFIMNGLDGSNGQLDPTAFVSLITPWALVGPNGATLSFKATGGNGLQIGKMSNPADPLSFTLIQEVTLSPNFEEYIIQFNEPCTTWIALKHSNTSTCNPLFVDDVLFRQNEISVIPESARPNITFDFEPLTGRIRLNSGIPIACVDLFNSLGQRVVSQHVSASTCFTLMLPRQCRGIYIVRCLSTDGRILTGKIHL